VRRWCLPAAALLLCAAGAAPVLRPTRDVDVTYAMDAGGGRTVQERLRWSVALRMLRVDPPSPGLYVIIDRSAGRMRVVRMADRTVTETAAPDNVAGVSEDAAAHAVRQGTEMVAGLACTDWNMPDAAGEPVTVCLTDDGVLLRAAAGARTLLTATTVQYGAVDPSVFQVPPGYAASSPETRK